MKGLTLLAVVIMLVQSTFAGGILTNTNQSTQFVRMLSRNASTDLDAVYFNPAGLTQLENGFYFGLHNQSIFQDRTITSGFPYLNDSIYKGELLVPVFPTAFAVYKLNNWAFSVGFGPNVGGGSIKYNNGLPSFEKLISSIPAELSSNRIPTSEYSSNIQFEGSSVFWGAQLNGSYAINDVISVSAGVRVIMANNTYNGYLKDIKINPNQPAIGASYTGEMVSATEFFAAGNTFLKGMATNSTAVSTGLTNAINGGTPPTTPLSDLPPATVSAVTQLLGAAGISATGMNIGTAAATLTAAAASFDATATMMETNSLATADMTVDTKQTGTGFTPIIGIDIHLDKLNIGLKYEHQTVLKLTNTTVVDGTGLFTDGEENRSDLPSIIAAGADYMATDKLKVSGSFTMFLDKNIGWGGNVYKQERTIDKNSMEIAFGLEYKLTDNFALSAGYMNSKIGVSEQFQSDFSFGNNYNTAGLGFQWNLNDRLVIDAGATLITYKDATKTFTADFDELADKFGEYNETYGNETFTVAFGIGYKIMEFKTKRRRRR
jgi:long-subunit fatty acid transport protein